MTEQEARTLLEKYEQGECTPEEKALLYSYYDELDRSLPEVANTEPYESIQSRTWQRLKQGAVHEHTKLRGVLWAAAATIALVFSAGVLYYSFSTKDTKQQLQIVNNQDKEPGTNKAVLTLADGREIQLDSAGNGVIAKEGGVTVSKGSNGQLIYTQSATRANSEAAYNTIRVPNGGQFLVQLPDGSTVFLNAGSRLKYPVAFYGNERRVSLTGEGYFEITKNEKMPFRVINKQQTVEVLGTHFNVASYDDDPVVTTLVEGKVKVSLSSSSESIKLKPGDQSTVKDAIVSVTKVNAEDVIAWKDGLFIFSNSSLKDVLRQLGRWYDVDVDFSAIPEMTFNGEIPRNVNLRTVLHLIETTSEVPLKLEGRRIMRK